MNPNTIYLLYGLLILEFIAGFGNAYEAGKGKHTIERTSGYYLAAMSINIVVLITLTYFILSS